MLLLVAIVAGAMGWIRVYYLHSDLADAQSNVVQLQMRLSKAEQSEAEALTRAGMNPVADSNTPPPSQPPVPSPAPAAPIPSPAAQAASSAAQTSSNNLTNTNAPPQPKPHPSGHLPSQVNRSNFRPH